MLPNAAKCCKNAGKFFPNVSARPSTELELLRDGGSGYKTYVFKESTRRCAIDRKGRGRKEVIYLRVADVSYTRGVYKSTGLLL